MTNVTLTPDDAPRLPELVATAEPGTRFELAPGRYPLEGLVVRGDVTLVGNPDPARTVLELKRCAGVERGSLTLVGLTLRGGRGTWGGAVEVVNGCRLALYSCVLAHNEASRIGGAIHLNPGEATFTRCVFRNNDAPAGGALSVHRGSQAIIDRCLFLENEAEVGGALMVNENARVLVKSCTFAGNKATYEPDEIEAEVGVTAGSAIALLGVLGYGPQVQLVNCLFCDARPLANHPLKPGRLQLASCLLPPGSLDRLRHADAGDNLQAEAELTELQGLPLLGPKSPGRGLGDITEIADGALDLLDRPLVVTGEADPGALGPLDGASR